LRLWRGGENIAKRNELNRIYAHFSSLQGFILRLIGQTHIFVTLRIEEVSPQKYPAVWHTAIRKRLLRYDHAIIAPLMTDHVGSACGGGMDGRNAGIDSVPAGGSRARKLPERRTGNRSGGGCVAHHAPLGARSGRSLPAILGSFIKVDAPIIHDQAAAWSRGKG
jgi:hypothetical protein